MEGGTVPGIPSPETISGMLESRSSGNVKDGGK